jgi:ABC-2 type transport system ATP-binding protein
MNSVTHPKITINIEGLEVSYENHVALKCESANFTGNVIALIGHNGAGKSTFIKTVLGLLVPSSGTVSVRYQQGFSDELELAPDKHMAFCPEMGSVFSDITVERYIQLWCRLKKSDSSFYKKGEGAALLEQLDIGPLMSRLGRELSKGQRRRVQTAIGFLIKPKLFLVDEPFDGLDVQRTHELTALIQGLAKDMTFIISSHRMDVMERLADFVIVLHGGAFLASGTVERVAESLATKTLTIDAMDEEDSVCDLLVEKLPQCVVNKLGGYVTVTGSSVDPTVVCELAGLPPESVRKSVPSLVDAMTYHLKNS